MSDNKPPPQTRPRSRRPRRSVKKLQPGENAVNREITATSHSYRYLSVGKLVLLCEVKEKPPPIPRDQIPAPKQVPVDPGPVLGKRARIDYEDYDDDDYDDDSWAAIKRRK